MSATPYAVVRAPAVDRAFARLPRDLKARLADAMRSLATGPRPHGFAPVKSRPGRFRIRVGDWRILYRVDDEARTVLVVGIMPRQDDYRQ